ncbi:MAG: GNAT family N-acetyltransferase [Pseudomonadota bacterium]
MRPARPADIAVVHALLHASWVATYGPIMGADAEALSLARHNERVLSAQLAAGNAFMIAEIDGAVVGHLHAYPKDGMYIDRLHTAAPAKGRGVGSALLDAFFAERPRGERVWLDVLVGNTAAMRFYEARGFQHTSTSSACGGLAGVPAQVYERVA